MFAIEGNNGRPNTVACYPGVKRDSRELSATFAGATEREGDKGKKVQRRRKGYLHMNTGRSLSLREWSRGDIYWFDKDSMKARHGIELTCLGDGEERGEPKRLLARDIRIPAYFSGGLL